MANHFRIAGRTPAIRFIRFAQCGRDARDPIIRFDTLRRDARDPIIRFDSSGGTPAILGPVFETLHSAIRIKK